MKNILLICCWLGNWAVTDINEIRTLFIASYDSQLSAQVFYNTFKNAGVLSPLLMGYKGMSEIMMCNYGFNPVTKLTHFINGKKLLEEAIAADNDNIELHFLRFTVQANAPIFLNYNSKLTEDKQLLTAYIQNNNCSLTDIQLQQMIKSYFKQ